MLASEFPNLFILVLFWSSKESAAGMEILYVQTYIARAERGQWLSLDLSLFYSKPKLLHPIRVFLASPELF